MKHHETLVVRCDDTGARCGDVGAWRGDRVAAWRSFDATTSALDAETSALDAETWALDVEASALDVEASALDVETSALGAVRDAALGAATSAIARSYRRGVFGDISDCGVGITPQMCNRVTNHGDMATFFKPETGVTLFLEEKFQRG